ncbi:hypothetical protein D3C78_1269990 [compost metagenome]
MELITPPNIRPTSGMKMASLYLILSRSFMNRNVPASANAKATSIFCIVLAEVKSINATSMPSLAESSVPAVVGDTNLLRLSCCIINPDMLIATPAMIMLTIRGKRLIVST